MRKNFILPTLTLLTLLTLFSCRKENLDRNQLDQEVKSITLDQAVSMMESSTIEMKSSSATTLNTPVNANKYFWFISAANYHSCTNPNVPAWDNALKARHGESYHLQHGSPLRHAIALTTMNNSAGRTGGSSISIANSFKKGSSYTVLLEIQAQDLLNANTGRPQKFPTLQLRLTNNPTDGQLCIDGLDGTDISGSSEPTQVIVSTSGTSRFVSVTFAADKCYDYLWINAKPNTDGTNIGRVILNNYIQINQNHHVTITGPNTLSPNQQAVFGLQAYGFPISNQLTWSVYGDLQIVGSNIGPNVTIKSTGLNGGKIYVSENGCHHIAEKVFASTTQHASISGPSYLMVQAPHHFPAPAVYTINFTGPLAGRVPSKVTWTSNVLTHWGEGHWASRHVTAPHETAWLTGILNATIELDGSVFEISKSIILQGNNTPVPPDHGGGGGGGVTPPGDHT